MTVKALQDELDNICLSSGDIIIDVETGAIGFLIERMRRIDIVEDDIYFWQLIWTNKEPELEGISKTNILEEENLKLSIILGIIRWQSIEGDSFDT
tara:strand:+ start:49 stop:336 length:288 start_codon:yes stop_codon:yes gene_type:complete